MSKVYVQRANTAYQSSASVASAASVTSGSFPTQGYARLTGLLYASASFVAGSGLRISQSADGGSNFDYTTDFAPSVSSASAFSIELVGNAAKIDFRPSSDASVFRTIWILRRV